MLNEFNNEELIIKDMVGRTVNATFERPKDISRAKSVLKVKQISSKNKIKNVPQSYLDNLLEG